jgi:hypothetical protein
MLEHVGLRPEELERIVVMLQANGESSLSTASWIAAVDLSTRDDWSARSHPRFVARTVGRQTVYDLPGVFSRTFSAWQPQERMLVFGDTSLVEQAIAQGAIPRRHPELVLIGTYELVGVAGDVSECEWLRQLLESWSAAPAALEAWELVAVIPSISDPNNYDLTQFETDFTNRWGLRIVVSTGDEQHAEELQLVLETVAGQFDATPHSYLTPGHASLGLSESAELHDEVENFLLAQIAWMKSSVYEIADIEPGEPLVGEPLPYGGWE